MEKEFLATEMMKNNKVSIIEQFEDFIKTYGETMEALTAFIGCKNAYYLSLSYLKDELPEKDLIWIYDFYKYFCQKYKNKIEDIEKNWPYGPLIFRIARQLEDEDQNNNLVS